jgi:hypothetical protein
VSEPDNHPSPLRKWLGMNSLVIDLLGAGGIIVAIIFYLVSLPPLLVGFVGGISFGVLAVGIAAGVSISSEQPLQSLGALSSPSDMNKLPDVEQAYEVEVYVPSAFVRPVLDNRSVCQVFLQVELRNPTPYRPNLVKYFLDFKVKGKETVRLTKILDLKDFQACNTIEYVDDEDGETWITYTDHENMDDLRRFIIDNGPPEDGFPSIGWLGFTVRKSVLPYGSYQRGLGYGHPILTDEGEPTGDEEEETETVYFPKFSEIEELKLVVVDGYQNSWEGIAAKINPKGEAVIPRPVSTG